MSQPTFVAKRFLLAVNGDMINADYIVKLTISNGKLFADMPTGPSIELRANDSMINDLRRALPINAVVAP